MTAYGHNWAFNEADKRAKTKRGHPPNCRCLRCIGSEEYRDVTRLYREAYERGDPPPLRGQLPGRRT